MAINLSSTDFRGLASLLSHHGEWRDVRGRIDFMTDVFAGVSKGDVVLVQLNLDGEPYGTAVRVVSKLIEYGRVPDGQEALGLLVNKLLAFFGGGRDAAFLRHLFSRYDFYTLPAAVHPVSTWHDARADDQYAEKIIGENTLRDIYVLEKLVELSRSVVRVATRTDLGTGFLIAADYVMTNHHVIRSPEEAATASFTFNYQLGGNGRVRPVRTVPSKAGGIFHASPMAPDGAIATADMLDFSIIQLAEPIADIKPLRLSGAQIEVDDRLAIIQHPGGSFKKISLQNNFSTYVDRHIVQYTTSTELGSSGAPVIAETLEVVALHHSGGDLLEPETNRRNLRNEGIRMSAILAHLQSRAPHIYEKMDILNACST